MSPPAQQPDAGVRVPQGTPVALTQIAATSRPQVSVPDLLGLGAAQARNILVKAGLNLGGTAFGRDDKRPPDTVIDQQPRARTNVEKGSAVSITVNQAPPPARLGYCCAPDKLKSDQPVGDVFRSDEATCGKRGGIFFTDQKSAEVICAKKYPSPLKVPAPPTSITIIK